MSALKSLLSVRKSTANNLCLIESGYPPLMYFVKEQQRRYFVKIAAREVDETDPLFYAIDLHSNASTTMFRYFSDVTSSDDWVRIGLNCIKDNVLASTRSKFLAYVSMNPDLTIHPVYAHPDVIEYKRITFTRLRLIAHNLKIETGRWSRIPRENRLCICDQIQTEEHILCHCPFTAHFIPRPCSLLSVFSMNELDLVDSIYKCVSFFD